MLDTMKNRTVGQLVAERPSRARVFEQHGIDYCCGGKRPLPEACAKKGVDLERVLHELSALEDVPESQVNPANMALSELADHIVATHHAYLRNELPRLVRMAERVATVHGDSDERLRSIATVMNGLADELMTHMGKEEHILFPIIRQLDREGKFGHLPAGALSYPIRVLEEEHDNSGKALEELKTLSDHYSPPDWACNTYRALFDSIRELEEDLHLHIHKENNILFPKALEREANGA